MIELPGVWAQGKTLEETRENLADVIDSWILIRLKKGLNIPKLGKLQIKEPEKIKIYA